MFFAVRLSGESWFSQFLEAFVEKLREAFSPGDIGEEIRANILQKQYHFSVGGINILLTDAVLIMWLAVLLLFFFAVWLGRKKERIPSGRQAFSETIVGVFLNLCQSNGMKREQAEQVAPFVGSICFFLVFCDLLSVFRLKPPAKNLAFPFALAFFTIISVIFISIRFVGVKGFCRSLVDPMKAMLPFKILDYIIKPMSLALRLFGNIFGAFILMEFVYIIMPAVLPWILGLWFDIGDGIIQAVVFAYLTTSYIGEILESAEKYEESHTFKKQAIKGSR